MATQPSASLPPMSPWRSEADLRSVPACHTTYLRCHTCAVGTDGTGHRILERLGLKMHEARGGRCCSPRTH